MRRPIAVNWTSYDLGQVADRVSDVAADLADYLGCFIPQGGGQTKHALMGPVAKVLSSARTELLVPEDLLGLAVRVHEQTSSDEGRGLSDDHRKKLETGVHKLVSLLNDVPAAARSDLLSRVDHAVYWLRKKSQLQRWSDVQQAFRQFLKDEYSDDEAFRDAWGEVAVKENWTMDRAPYPSRGLTARGGQIDADVTRFWELRRGEGSPPEDTDD